jgi:hypothetical protein
MTIAGNMLKVSMFVERNIDGEWFLGEILSISADENQLRIRYIDDDNVEDCVPSAEVRIVPSSRDALSPASKKLERKNTLPKPLAGLMDDDADIRYAHLPTTVVHEQSEDGELILLSLSL